MYRLETRHGIFMDCKAEAFKHEDPSVRFLSYLENGFLCGFTITIYGTVCEV